MGQMNPGRPDVSHGKSHARGELALNVEVPLHLIAARRIGLNARSLKRAQAKQIKRAARKAGSRGTGDGTLAIKWRGSREEINQQIRQWDDIEHSDATPDRGLAILEGIPGKADARRKV